MVIRSLISICQVVIILSIPKYLYGCECASSTSKFMDGLKNYDFVGLIEVVGRDTTKNYDYDNAFTLVKILKQYQGKSIGTSISVVEGQGFECFVSLPNVNIGSRFIVKGSFDKRSEYEANFPTKAKSPNTNDTSSVLI